MKKIIAIVGGGISWAGKIKKIDFGKAEIWTVARLIESFPTAIRAYEIHEEETFKSYLPSIKRAVGRGVDLYMRHPIDGARPVPFEDLKAMSGGFHTSSLSVMVAHATLEGASEIQLYGFPLVAMTYLKQRPSVYYHIGFAAGRGVRITDRSDIIQWEANYGA